MKDKMNKLFGSMFSGSKEKEPQAGDSPGRVESPVDSLLGKKFEGYFVRELIGEGAQGKVYRVTPTEDSQSPNYALKFCARQVPSIEKELENPNLPEPQRKNIENKLSMALNDDKRFSREMNTLMNKLNHANVIKPLKYGSEDEHHWVIMPYLGKVSLDSRLEQGSLENSELLSIFKDISDGLQTVHDQDIVHRDLKPQNIMLDKGKAIIIDFGFVKGKDDKTFTAPGSLLGTTAYMAPEQINFQEPQNKKTDQFTLGVMIYFSLTSSFPYPVKGLNSLLTRDRYEYDSLLKYRPDLASDSDDVLQKMMAKTQKERFETVKDAYEAFAATSSFL